MQLKESPRSLNLERILFRLKLLVVPHTRHGRNLKLQTFQASGVRGTPMIYGCGCRLIASRSQKPGWSSPSCSPSSAKCSSWTLEVLTTADQVLATGDSAEYALLSFLESHNIRAKSSSSIVKQMRLFHHRGMLGKTIRDYDARIAFKVLLDSAPEDFHCGLAVTSGF